MRPVIEVALLMAAELVLSAGELTGDFCTW
jgi:hypothetical protein